MRRHTPDHSVADRTYGNGCSRCPMVCKIMARCLCPNHQQAYRVDNKAKSCCLWMTYYYEIILPVLAAKRYLRP